MNLNQFITASRALPKPTLPRVNVHPFEGTVVYEEKAYNALAEYLVRAAVCFDRADSNTTQDGGLALRQAAATKAGLIRILSLIAGK